MFTSLESFSIFFFTSLALLLLGIIFDKQLISLEKKIDRKIAQKKAAKKAVNLQKTKHAQKQQLTKPAVRSTKHGLAA